MSRPQSTSLSQFSNTHLSYTTSPNSNIINNTPSNSSTPSCSNRNSLVFSPISNLSSAGITTSSSSTPIINSNNNTATLNLIAINHQQNNNNSINNNNLNSAIINTYSSVSTSTSATNINTTTGLTSFNNYQTFSSNGPSTFSSSNYQRLYNTSNIGSSTFSFSNIIPVTSSPSSSSTQNNNNILNTSQQHIPFSSNFGNFNFNNNFSSNNLSVNSSNFNDIISNNSNNNSSNNSINNSNDNSNNNSNNNSFYINHNSHTNESNNGIHSNIIDNINNLTESDNAFLLNTTNNSNNINAKNFSSSSHHLIHQTSPSSGNIHNNSVRSFNMGNYFINPLTFGSQPVGLSNNKPNERLNNIYNISSSSAISNNQSGKLVSSTFNEPENNIKISDSFHFNIPSFPTHGIPSSRSSHTRDISRLENSSNLTTNSIAAQTYTNNSQSSNSSVCSDTITVVNLNGAFALSDDESLESKIFDDQSHFTEDSDKGDFIPNIGMEEELNDEYLNSDMPLDLHQDENPYDTFESSTINLTREEQLEERNIEHQRQRKLVEENNLLYQNQQQAYQVYNNILNQKVYSDKPDEIVTINRVQDSNNNKKLSSKPQNSNTPTNLFKHPITESTKSSLHIPYQQLDTSTNHFKDINLLDFLQNHMKEKYISSTGQIHEKILKKSLENIILNQADTFDEENLNFEEIINDVFLPPTLPALHEETLLYSEEEDQQIHTKNSANQYTGEQGNWLRTMSQLFHQSFNESNCSSDRERNYEKEKSSFKSTFQNLPSKSSMSSSFLLNGREKMREELLSIAKKPSIINDIIFRCESESNRDSILYSLELAIRWISGVILYQEAMLHGLLTGEGRLSFEQSILLKFSSLNDKSTSKERIKNALKDYNKQYIEDLKKDTLLNTSLSELDNFLIRIENLINNLITISSHKINYYSKYLYREFNICESNCSNQNTYQGSPNPKNSNFSSNLSSNYFNESFYSISYYQGLNEQTPRQFHDINASQVIPSLFSSLVQALSLLRVQQKIFECRAHLSSENCQLKLLDSLESSYSFAHSLRTPLALSMMFMHRDVKYPTSNSSRSSSNNNSYFNLNVHSNNSSFSSTSKSNLDNNIDPFLSLYFPLYIDFSQSNIVSYIQSLLQFAKSNPNTPSLYNHHYHDYFARNLFHLISEYRAMCLTNKMFLLSQISPLTFLPSNQSLVCVRSSNYYNLFRGDSLLNIYFIKLKIIKSEKKLRNFNDLLNSISSTNLNISSNYSGFSSNSLASSIANSNKTSTFSQIKIPNQSIFYSSYSPYYNAIYEYNIGQQFFDSMSQLESPHFIRSKLFCATYCYLKKMRSNSLPWQRLGQARLNNCARSYQYLILSTFKSSHMNFNFKFNSNDDDDELIYLSSTINSSSIPLVSPFNLPHSDSNSSHLGPNSMINLSNSSDSFNSNSVSHQNSINLKTSIHPSLDHFKDLLYPYDDSFNCEIIDGPPISPIHLESTILESFSDCFSMIPESETLHVFLFESYKDLFPISFHSNQLKLLNSNELKSENLLLFPHVPVMMNLQVAISSIVIQKDCQDTICFNSTIPSLSESYKISNCLEYELLNYSVQSFSHYINSVSDLMPHFCLELSNFITLISSYLFNLKQRDEFHFKSYNLSLNLNRSDSILLHGQILFDKFYLIFLQDLLKIDSLPEIFNISVTLNEYYNNRSQPEINLKNNSKMLHIIYKFIKRLTSSNYQNLLLISEDLHFYYRKTLLDYSYCLYLIGDSSRAISLLNILLSHLNKLPNSIELDELKISILAQLIDIYLSINDLKSMKNCIISIRQIRKMRIHSLLDTFNPLNPSSVDNITNELDFKSFLSSFNRKYKDFTNISSTQSKSSISSFSSGSIIQEFLRVPLRTPDTTSPINPFNNSTINKFFKTSNPTYFASPISSISTKNRKFFRYALNSTNNLQKSRWNSSSTMFCNKSSSDSSGFGEESHLVSSILPSFCMINCDMDLGLVISSYYERKKQYEKALNALNITIAGTELVIFGATNSKLFPYINLADTRSANVAIRDLEFFSNIDIYEGNRELAHLYYLRAKLQLKICQTTDDIISFPIEVGAPTLLTSLSFLKPQSPKYSKNTYVTSRTRLYYLMNSNTSFNTQVIAKSYQNMIEDGLFGYSPPHPGLGYDISVVSNLLQDITSAKTIIYNNSADILLDTLKWLKRAQFQFQRLGDYSNFAKVINKISEAYLLVSFEQFSLLKIPLDICFNLSQFKKYNYKNEIVFDISSNILNLEDIRQTATNCLEFQNQVNDPLELLITYINRAEFLYLTNEIIDSLNYWTEAKELFLLLFVEGWGGNLHSKFSEYNQKLSKTQNSELNHNISAFSLSNSIRNINRDWIKKFLNQDDPKPFKPFKSTTSSSTSFSKNSNDLTVEDVIEYFSSYREFNSIKEDEVNNGWIERGGGLPILKICDIPFGKKLMKFFDRLIRFLFIFDDNMKNMHLFLLDIHTSSNQLFNTRLNKLKSKTFQVCDFAIKEILSEKSKSIISFKKDENVNDFNETNETDVEIDQENIMSPVSSINSPSNNLSPIENGLKSHEKKKGFIKSLIKKIKNKKNSQAAPISTLTVSTPISGLTFQNIQKNCYVNDFPISEHSNQFSISELLNEDVYYDKYSNSIFYPLDNNTNLTRAFRSESLILFPSYHLSKILPRSIHRDSSNISLLIRSMKQKNLISSNFKFHEMKTKKFLIQNNISIKELNTILYEFDFLLRTFNEKDMRSISPTSLAFIFKNTDILYSSQELKNLNNTLLSNSTSISTLLSISASYFMKNSHSSMGMSELNKNLNPPYPRPIHPFLDWNLGLESESPNVINSIKLLRSKIGSNPLTYWIPFEILDYFPVLFLSYDRMNELYKIATEVFNTVTSINASSKFIYSSIERIFASLLIVEPDFLTRLHEFIDGILLLKLWNTHKKMRSTLRNHSIKNFSLLSHNQNLNPHHPLSPLHYLSQSTLTSLYYVMKPILHNPYAFSLSPTHIKFISVRKCISQSLQLHLQLRSSYGSLLPKSFDTEYLHNFFSNFSEIIDKKCEFYESKKSIFQLIYPTPSYFESKTSDNQILIAPSFELNESLRQRQDGIVYILKLSGGLVLAYHPFSNRQHVQYIGVPHINISPFRFLTSAFQSLFHPTHPIYKLINPSNNFASFPYLVNNSLSDVSSSSFFEISHSNCGSIDGLTLDSVTSQEKFNSNSLPIGIGGIAKPFSSNSSIPILKMISNECNLFTINFFQPLPNSNYSSKLLFFKSGMKDNYNLIRAIEHFSQLFIRFFDYELNLLDPSNPELNNFFYEPPHLSSYTPLVIPNNSKSPKESSNHVNNCTLDTLSEKVNNLSSNFKVTSDLERILTCFNSEILNLNMRNYITNQLKISEDSNFSQNFDKNSVNSTLYSLTSSIFISNITSASSVIDRALMYDFNLLNSINMFNFEEKFKIWEILSNSGCLSMIRQFLLSCYHVISPYHHFFHHLKELQQNFIINSYINLPPSQSSVSNSPPPKSTLSSTNSINSTSTISMYSPSTLLPVEFATYLSNTGQLSLDFYNQKFLEDIKRSNLNHLNFHSGAHEVVEYDKDHNDSLSFHINSLSTDQTNEINFGVVPQDFNYQSHFQKVNPINFKNKEKNNNLRLLDQLILPELNWEYTSPQLLIIQDKISFSNFPYELILPKSLTLTRISSYNEIIDNSMMITNRLNQFDSFFSSSLEPSCMQSAHIPSYFHPLHSHPPLLFTIKNNLSSNFSVLNQSNLAQKMIIIERESLTSDFENSDIRNEKNSASNLMKFLYSQIVSLYHINNITRLNTFNKKTVHYHLPYFPILILPLEASILLSSNESSLNIIKNYSSTLDYDILFSIDLLKESSNYSSSELIVILVPYNYLSLFIIEFQKNIEKYHNEIVFNSSASYLIPYSFLLLKVIKLFQLKYNIQIMKNI